MGSPPTTCTRHAAGRERTAERPAIRRDTWESLHPAGSAPGALVAAWAGADGPVEARVTADADGLALTVDGADWGPVCHGRVQALSAGALLAQTPADCAVGPRAWSRVREAGADPVSLPGDADGVLPVVLAAGAAAPLLWRDGAGQAWLATLDAGGALSGAAPLGDPGDPSALHLDPDRPGAVWLPPPPHDTWPAAPLDGWTAGVEVSADTALLAVVPGGAAACGWQVVAWPAEAPSGPGAVVASSDDPACADLPVPLAVGSLDGRGSAVVSISADGQIGLTRLVEGVVWHREGPRLAVAAPRARASTGDLDGDGLDDVVLAGLSGAPARALRSDGLGGLAPLTTDPLAGLNVVGLAGPAPGRPTPARPWDGALPHVQRRVVPVGP